MVAESNPWTVRGVLTVAITVRSPWATTWRASGTQASTISTANPVIAGGRNTTRTADATSTTGTVSPMYAARKMPAAASPLACGAASAAAYDTARIPHTNRAINNPGSVLHTRKMATDNTSVSNP